MREVRQVGQRPGYHPLEAVRHPCAGTRVGGRIETRIVGYEPSAGGQLFYAHRDFSCAQYLAAAKPGNVCSLAPADGEVARFLDACEPAGAIRVSSVLRCMSQLAQGRRLWQSNSFDSY